MSRFPIRVRLTVLFALVLAVVLAVVGTTLYLSVRATLDEGIDESLAARADDLAQLVARDALPPQLAGDDEDRFAEVRDASGRVLARSAPAPREGFRLVRRQAAGGATITVGASLDDRDEALATLARLLLIGGPIALGLATLAAYLVAGAALRPVEAMRRRAAEISSETSGERLPVPPSRDEIQRLGETLNEMLERLDAGLVRQRRFVADASHELRTPLSLLRTELELALRRPRTPEEHEAALRSVAEEVDRLVRLAEGLLLLATAEETGIQPERIQVRGLLESVARRFGNAAAVEVDDTLVEVVADRLRLEAALGNLVENARRHGAPPIRLEAAREGDDAVFRVTDAGPGFPPDFLEHAFERFSRADEARTEKGAGLGLAIVDAVARAHGGRASASGSTVTLVLPR
jgi:signal transduction histidine kinase